MEIPPNIRFNFLSFLLGLVMVVAPFYFNFQNNLASSSLMLIGIYFLALGFSSIKYEYDLEIELEELEYAK